MARQGPDLATVHNPSQRDGFFPPPCDPARPGPPTVFERRVRIMAHAEAVTQTPALNTFRHRPGHPSRPPVARQGPDLSTVQRQYWSQQDLRPQAKGGITNRRTPLRSMRASSTTSGGRHGTADGGGSCSRGPFLHPGGRLLGNLGSGYGASASSRKVSTGPGERQWSMVKVAATPSMRHPAVRRRDARGVRGRVAIGLATPSSRELPGSLRWSLGRPTLGPAGRSPRTAYMFPAQSDLSIELLLC